MWVHGWGEVPGRLIVISGPSGSGKSTLIRRALERPEVRATLSVSATSRAPRPGEREGVEYYFLTREAFEAAVGRGEFLESATYNGNLYGTPAGPVRRALEAGRCVVLEIETEGAMQVRERVPTALFVFVDVPDFGALAERLRLRGTESAEQVHQRLVIARRERDRAPSYDTRIINDELGRATDELVALLARQGCGG
jgi:guanylate kinase